tara:strand:- start:105 stop:749 length:645 start_codon:yes stop_codon:yes gene_type:complete
MMATERALYVDEWVPLGIWGTFLVFFHVSEFCLASYYHPPSPFSVGNMPWRSCLFSIPYLVVTSIVILEFCLEAVYWRESKGLLPVVCAGASLMLVGECIRKTAMVTAAKSFTHDIALEGSASHVLITDGVYGICRHPGYMGWFIWVVGGQVLLTNPVSFIIQALITWLFFYQRIQFEERHLLSIFGQEYSHYKEAVYFSGIPFVKGIKQDSCK